MPTNREKKVLLHRAGQALQHGRELYIRAGGDQHKWDEETLAILRGESIPSPEPDSQLVLPELSFENSTNPTT